MLMPRPPHIQWRKTATAHAYQLNMNNAAKAPQWRSPKTTLLVQFSFRDSALVVRSVLKWSVPDRCAVKERCHTAPLYTNNKLVAVDGFKPPSQGEIAADVIPVRVGTDPRYALETRKGTG